MLAELVVGWKDYVAKIQTMSRDMIKLQLSQHLSRDMSFMSRRSGIMLWLLYI